MTDVLKFHDDIFKFLYSHMEENHDFVFMPRQKNNQGKLDRGFWFPGDEDGYLSVNFYEGGDNFNKTGNITFVMIFKEQENINANTCGIQLSNTPGSTGYSKKRPVIEEILRKITGFEVDCCDSAGIARRWNRYYRSLDHLESLKRFIALDKPIIDKIVSANDACGIGFLNENKSRTAIFRTHHIMQRKRLGA